MTEPTGNVRPPSDGFEQRMRAIEARLTAVEQRPATKLGRMSVTDPDGVDSIYVGPDPNGLQLRPDGLPQWRSIFRRGGGGSVLLTRATTDTEDGSYRQFWALTDSTGRFIVSDDAYTGQGLATPWSPFQMFPQFSMGANTQWQYMTIDNGFLHVEKSLWEGFIPRVSHPRIEISGVWGVASGSSTAPTYRLYLNGEATPRDTWSVAGAPTAQLHGCSVVDLLDHQWVQCVITAVVPTGTGAQIAASVRGAAQRQS